MPPTMAIPTTSNFFKKNWLYGVVLIILVAFFFQTKACINLKADKAVFSVLEKQYKADIKTKTNEITALTKDATKWKEASIANEKLAEKNNTDALKWFNAYQNSLTKIKDLTGKIEKMTADQIVKEFQTLLGLKETEVWLSSLGIIFNDSGSKKNLTAVTKWNTYEKETIPALNKTIDSKSAAATAFEASVAQKNRVITDQANIIAKKDGIIVDKDGQLIDRDKIISDQKKSLFWSHVREFLLPLATAFLVKTFWR